VNASSWEERIPWLSPLLSVWRFIKTRRLIIRGEIQTLLDVSKDGLVSLGVMGSWKFNLYQSSLSAGVSFAAVKCLNWLHPPPDQSALIQWGKLLRGDLSPLSPEDIDLYSWYFSIRATLAVLIVPFTLMPLAWAAGWASIWSKDATGAKRARARDAYLYYDAAYGFYPQTLAALTSSLLATSAVFGLLLREDIGALGVAVGGGGLAALWCAFVTGRVIPSRLFRLNGYAGTVPWWPRRLGMAKDPSGSIR